MHDSLKKKIIINFQVDIWSFGILISELLLRKTVDSCVHRTVWYRMETVTDNKPTLYNFSKKEKKKIFLLS